MQTDFKLNDHSGFAKLFILSLGILCLYILYKVFVLSIDGLDAYPYVALISVLPAIFLFNIRYPENEKSFKTLLYGILIICGCYLLFMYPGYSYSAQSYFVFPYTLNYVALIFILAGFFRPSFVLFPISQVFWLKRCDINITGYYISSTDYKTIVEIGLVLGISVLVFELIRKSGKLERYPIKNSELSLYDFVVLGVIAVHFGSYFHSGLAKLYLDGGILSWITENKTHFLILTSIQTGLSPIANFESIWTYLFELFEEGYVLNNVIVVVLQLAAVIAIQRINWIIILTIIYDITHVVIYVLTGIFFWKWILLNIAIVLALRSRRDCEIPMQARYLLSVIVMCGIAFFFTARLAWYDSPMMNDIYITANTSEKSGLRVPTNYFLNVSLPFAQSRQLRDIPGHLKAVDSLGSVYSYDLMNKYSACRPEYNEKGDNSDKVEFLKSYIKVHHEYILTKVNGRGLFNYDLFPHHMWSNPFLFEEFYALDKREITSYNVNIDTICLVKNNNMIEKTLFKHTDYEVTF